MAAKSDFAQKLLHDLRLRKERMGVSQSSTRSNATARDAYRNPGNVQRGSRQTKSLESIGGPKMANQQQMYGGSSRAPIIKESSQQIVSYVGGRHQRSESMGDFPMSFTYAVKNGGKLLNVDFSSSGNTNTMIDFLHQIGRRSLDVGNSRNEMSSLVKHRSPSNSGGVVVPALTNTQIKEISKGVQNLYEILRSNSNGMNVDRHSMEVGKELLKGAKGLEESLKMLVNLQEASELMGSPKRKSRITLMEVDEDDRADGSKIVDQNQNQNQNQNQVALPRFSFDKPSKKSNLALTDSGSKLSTHRRSASCGSENLRTVSITSDTKNSSSRSENGRISNVIAKLMGLEEVHHVELKNNESKIQVKAKDSVAPINDRKPQQNQESDKNVVPRNAISTKQIDSNRSGQVSEKKERSPSNGETKDKIQPIKRRSAELAAANLVHERVDKKKTIRMEKSNEIKRNNQIQEPEKKTQKISKQVKSRESPSKEPQMQPPKPKEATPKPQESQLPERTVKEKPVIRKKVDSIVLRRTEDEILKRRNINGTLKNLGTTTPSKHKLSVLKETQRKDVQQLVLPISSKQEDTNVTRSNSKNQESRLIQVDDDNIVPICENVIKIDREVAEIRQYKENKPKKPSYSIQVVLNEQEKQLKEILIKDQLFLSTAEALFRLNIPVGFLHADDHNHHSDENKLKLDCGTEILRRKARSQELSAHPYVKPTIGGATIRFLDELVKQLYKDLESLRLYGRNIQNEYDGADYLHYMLERDIYNKNPDINSFWDIGWHTMTFTFVEKDEFVNDVEQDVLHRLVDEMVDDLLSMSLPF